jgi:ribulose-5-phosphate 4-epimerase/fuculose-1-phosphate aldolase
MADGSIKRETQMPAGPKPGMAAAEWDARVELAALYRLAALHGWDDAIFTHISLRIPGPEHHFLVNPYGVFFDEMTASALVKVDLDGTIVAPTEYGINPAGFTIHSAIHTARADARCVIHLHTVDGVGVSAQADGLLPISQTALVVLPALAYHDYEGIALHLDERERLVRDLGDRSMMLLRNHGTLAIGESAAAAWTNMFFLERACSMQVAALSAGRDGVLRAPDDSQRTVSAQTRGAGAAGASSLAWPGFLRLLDRKLPGYAV